MKLQFKFKEKAEEELRKRMVDALNQRGAMAVRRLFSDETDDELAAVYVVDFEGEAAGQRLLELLKRSKDIEFAEGEVRRKLIR